MHEREAACEDAKYSERHDRISGYDRRDCVRPLRRGVLSSRNRQSTVSSLAMLLWFYCFILGLAPTVRSVRPHLRACPGPLDGGNASVYEFSSVFLTVWK